MRYSEVIAEDVINLIGGIANALEGIVYGDDNQVKGIHFKQISSQRDRYKIRIRTL
jgi:Holliday junction resolvase RusA-like endonuclease